MGEIGSIEIEGESLLSFLHFNLSDVFLSELFQKPSNTESLCIMFAVKTGSS